MKKKKVFIRVAGNPQFRQPASPNRFLICPASGTPVFGDFPALSVPGKDFPAGPIYLLEGRHHGPNRGYGFRHVWLEHFAAETDPVRAESTVIAFVSGVLVAKASIYYEGGIGTQIDRALVWQSAKGAVILEQRIDGGNRAFYGVVTAFPARGGPHGVRIGCL